MGDRKIKQYRWAGPGLYRVLIGVLAIGLTLATDVTLSYLGYVTGPWSRILIFLLFLKVMFYILKNYIQPGKSRSDNNHQEH